MLIMFVLYTPKAKAYNYCFVVKHRFTRVGPHPLLFEKSAEPWGNPKPISAFIKEDDTKLSVGNLKSKAVPTHNCDDKVDNLSSKTKLPIIDCTHRENDRGDHHQEEKGWQVRC